MKSVPFFANTEDDTHCFQAAMKMILKYFLPERDFSWEELETLSAKIPGLATWPQQMLINLQDMGFEIIDVEGFDGHAFAEEGGEYLRREFGDEVADWQIKNSDITQEQKLYRKLLALKDVKIEHRIPSLSEMKKLVNDGYLVHATLNARSLNGNTGYIGHSVVIYKMTDDEVELHDPGLPPVPNRRVLYTAFEKSWADPNEMAKNYIALRLKGEPT